MNFRNMMKNKQDRLMAFFDAILAIAITVLALEISVPQLSSINTAEKHDFLVIMTCYLISFTAMATLWYIHNNFFSIYDLTGNSSEIVLHLILLFVITLFQPLTRAVGEYPDDMGVRLCYIGAFLLMELLLTIIIVLVRHNQMKVQVRKDTAKQIFRDSKSAAEDTETDKWDRLLDIAYAVNNPQETLEAAKDHLPEAYVEMIEEESLQRRNNFKISIFSTLIMTLSIMVAVFGLMFSLWITYFSLAVGFAALVLIRFTVDQTRKARERSKENIN